MMVDLHMHTTYSDGTDSVKELLKKVEDIGLEVISITDHDTCNAYFEMEKFNVKEIYKGDIIVGCEFSASFDNRTIEIIGYGFDYKVVNKYLEKFYDETLIEKRTEILFNRLFAKINELGLEFHIPRENIPINKYYEIAIYNELKKYPAAFYYSVCDSISLTQELLESWLTKYMFKNDKKGKIKEVMLCHLKKI